MILWHHQQEARGSLFPEVWGRGGNPVWLWHNRAGQRGEGALSPSANPCRLEALPLWGPFCLRLRSLFLGPLTDTPAPMQPPHPPCT